MNRAPLLLGHDRVLAAEPGANARSGSCAASSEWVSSG